MSCEYNKKIRSIYKFVVLTVVLVIVHKLKHLNQQCRVTDENISVCLNDLGHLFLGHRRGKKRTTPIILI